MSDKNILFVTKVGSHLWKMNNENSDDDFFVCYAMKSSDMLIGKREQVTVQKITDGKDVTTFEIGHIVNEALKNNFNFIVGVMSDLIIKDWEHFNVFKHLTRINLSKLCYNSIHGLAIHNYEKYITLEKDHTQKKLNQIARIVKMGITMLDEGIIKFEKIDDNTKKDVEALVKDLDSAYDNSRLPEKPENESKMYEFLLKIRIENLIRERKELVNNGKNQ